jgi:N-acetylglucosamine-6-sulfatase
MTNLFENGFNGTEDADIVRLAERLDSLTYVLKSCRGDSCRYPWEALMPEENVHTLAEAMDPDFDEFFHHEVPRIVYSSCEAGHIVEAEGPQFETWEERVSPVKREFQEGPYLTRELARKYLFLA